MYMPDYFNMYREGLWRDYHTDGRYIPKHSAKVKNKRRAAKHKKGKKK